LRAGTRFRKIPMELKKTPHPPSSVGHPLPKGEGCDFDFSLSLGERVDRNGRFYQPGRVRGPFVDEHR